MKRVKGFFLTKGKPKGSMVEGNIVYELFYYASEYITQIDHTLGTLIWDDEHDEDKREGKVLEMNKKRCMININSLFVMTQYEIPKQRHNLGQIWLDYY